MTNFANTDKSCHNMYHMYFITVAVCSLITSSKIKQMEAVQFLMKALPPPNKSDSNSIVQACCHLESLIDVLQFSLFGSSVCVMQICSAIRAKANSGSQ